MVGIRPQVLLRELPAVFPAFEVDRAHHRAAIGRVSTVVDQPGLLRDVRACVVVGVQAGQLLQARDSAHAGPALLDGGLVHE
eukprot:16041682-Heterocapsa_arctica.AAC.1